MKDENNIHSPGREGSVGKTEKGKVNNNFFFP